MWLGWCCVGTTSQMRVSHLWFLALAQLCTNSDYTLLFSTNSWHCCGNGFSALSNPVCACQHNTFIQRLCISGFQGSAWLVVEQCSSPSLHTTALDWNINQPSQPSKAVNERPAVAGFPRPPVEASPWCSTHTYTHMHIRTITPTRRVMWTKEMQLPARVRLREQSSKLCPHSWRRMWWERHSLSFTRNTHSQRSNSQAPPPPPPHL